MSDKALGYMGALVSVVMFGSNFVPLKRVRIGDGVFFQFIMCNAIFMSGIPVAIIQKFPPVYGEALIGGVLWCTGNMLCPIAIRLIGMGMGLLMWGSIGMILGWACGSYGLLFVDKQDISDETLNVIGLVIVLIGLVIFLQVKTNDTSVDNVKYKKLQNEEVPEGNPEYSISSPLSPANEDNDVELVFHASTIQVKEEHKGDFFATWSDQSKRITGITLAGLAGCMFGVAFNPSQHINDTRFDGGDDPLNYVFSHFLGIYLASWGYTILYCLYKQIKDRRPYVPHDAILPASISGIMWGIAQACWFYANGKLSFSMTFPIVSSGPGFVGSLWGIFLFKEITGTTNYLLLTVAFAITFAGLICIALAH